MEELDHAVLAFDSYPIEFGTLVSKIVKGIVKIISRNVKRKINSLDAMQYRVKRTMLTGRQYCIRSCHSSVATNTREEQ